MNILSAALPGLREMRTPLAVGALWLVAIAMAAARWWENLVREVPSASLLTDVGGVTELSTTVPLIAAAAFFAYLLGCGINPLSSGYSGLISGGIDRFIGWTRPRQGPHRLTRLVRRIEAPRERRESIVRDVVNSEYARASLPAGAANAFEWRLVDGELESLSMQLWSRASDQYQEYDRVRAERAFRAGVSLPLLAVALLSSIAIVWWLGIPLIALSVVLAVQARFLEEEQRELMANALRARLVTSPLLERVIGMAKAAELEQDAPWADWSVLTAVVMERTGHLGEAGAAFDRAMASVIEGVDLTNESTWRSRVMRRGDVLITRFNSLGDGDMAERMSADLKFRCDRVVEEKTRMLDAGFDPRFEPEVGNQKLTELWYAIAPGWGGQPIPSELAPYYPGDRSRPSAVAGGK